MDKIATLSGNLREISELSGAGDDIDVVVDIDIDIDDGDARVTEALPDIGVAILFVGNGGILSQRLRLAVFNQPGNASGLGK